jgi:hypothetical protein
MDYTKIDEFILRSEDIAKAHDKEEAFKIITSEIDVCDNTYINDYVAALNFIQYEKVLEWIEKNSPRITNVHLNWGHLAASSQFSWDRADKWLTKGRPLSLIALDALVFCTTTGDRLNQSLWMRQLQPKLIDNPRPEIIANRLREYLLVDSVPRTKNAIDKIIYNVFPATT